ncbi:MAG: hypothetical protein HY329_19140 [Chloroflexi bacterium]|nr:hypothetical protein [Chloroflexota bacterium]
MAQRSFAEASAGANVGKAILGGFVGTVLMTILLYVGPSVGFPPMDLATMLGTLFVRDTNTAFWLGLALHFTMGSVVLAWLYAALYRYLPGPPWVRGTVWGIGLWLLSQAVVMPLLGSVHPQITAGQMPAPGFFTLNLGVLAPIGSLIGHLVYGATLGAIYGHPEPVREASYQI